MTIDIFDHRWLNNIRRLLTLNFKKKSEEDISHLEAVKTRLFPRKIEDSFFREIEKELVMLGLTYCFENTPDCGACPVHSFCNWWREKQKGGGYEKWPFVDLFCGAGGLSLGLEKSGFHPVFALDNDDAACRTYLFNRPWMEYSSVVNYDIRQFVCSSADIPRSPIVVGGPPCQGFSNANRQRLSDDPRNQLYKAFKRFVSISGASICIMENVPGMLAYQEAVQRDFSDIDFLIKPVIVNTKDFGYPQNRRRVFWFGLKTADLFTFNSVFEVFSAAVRSPLSEGVFHLMDAICDLPRLGAKTEKNATHLENAVWGYTIDAQRVFDTPYARMINGGKKRSYLFNHRTKYNNPRDVEIYARLSPGERSDAESIRHLMPYGRRSEIFLDKFFKLQPEQPSKTITAHMYYDCHMYIHPFQARGLTPREAARIQGFPDDYFFLGLPNQWYRQIGNAVSPLVARHVGCALAKVLRLYEREILYGN